MRTTSTMALAAGTLLLAGATFNAQGIPTTISGTLSLSGSATTDTSNLSTATKFLSFQDVTVGSASTLSGDYAGATGASVTMSPFTWSPIGASTPVDNLWEFVSGGITYSFDLASLSVDYVTSSALVMSGFGTASISGPGMEKLDTSGLWKFSAQTLGESSFTFASSTEVPPPTTNVPPPPATSIPDGGATRALLGFGLLSLSVLKRNLSA